MVKKLSELCRRIVILGTNLTTDINVYGVEIDSKKVKEGFAFFVTDGNESYVREAISRGASCLIAEKGFDYPCVVVDDVRKSMALGCSDFYDNPEKRVKIVGVVGTNGKSSVAYMLYEMTKPDKKVAAIGTLGVMYNDMCEETGMTTPDPPRLFEILSKLEKEGVEYVFCEVTAHAIYYKKLYGIRLETCIFTNVTQDHLDFFGDMKTYADVKIGYFTKNNMKMGIINVDDPYGREIVSRASVCCVSYGIDRQSDVIAIGIEENEGLKMTINAFTDTFYLRTRLSGRFNVYNTLACVAFARTIGMSVRDIRSRFQLIRPVEGRLNVLREKPKVVVDFAHTPDGVKNVLLTLRKMTRGKLYAVFGCGGNRDKSKRPIMGRIASEIADVCVFTSDNPRDEAADAIIAEIVCGVGDGEYVCIPDRRRAIEYALSVAREDDCVAILGKGAEKYMEICGEKIPYDDREVCRAFWEKNN